MFPLLLSKSLILAQLTFTPLCSPVDVIVSDRYFGGVGQADPKNCLIYLAPSWYTWPPYFVCTVMTHEMGHLAGLSHSPDPKNIMYGGNLTVTPKPCIGLKRPRVTIRHRNHRKQYN